VTHASEQYRPFTDAADTALSQKRYPHVALVLPDQAFSQRPRNRSMRVVSMVRAPLERPVTAAWRPSGHR
jgi:hypothetical protein